MNVAYAPCCFLSSYNFQNKEVDFFLMFLFSKMGYYRYIFSGGGGGITLWTLLWRSTFSLFCEFLQRSVSCGSIMPILLTFIILCMLIIWYMLFYTTIIGGTCCFPKMTTELWIIFTRAVWLTLYKHSLKR